MPEPALQSVWIPRTAFDFPPDAMAHIKPNPSSPIAIPRKSIHIPDIFAG
jgi:hypothetical protein